MDEAVRAAAGMGLPAQNLDAGRPHWPHCLDVAESAIPRRVGTDDPNRPRGLERRQTRWQGYLGPDEQPVVLDPADGRLWTANSRMVGGAALAKLGQRRLRLAPGPSRSAMRCGPRSVSTKPACMPSRWTTAHSSSRWQRLLLTGC